MNKDKQKARAYQLFYNFGLSYEEYRNMHEMRNDRCDVCGLHNKDPETGLSKDLIVDYDKETRRVRGLLCAHCSLAIKTTRADEDYIGSLLAYIRGKNE